MDKPLEGFRRNDVRLQKRLKTWASQGPQWELKSPSKLHLAQSGWKMEPVRQGLVYGMKYRSCQRNSRRSSLQQTGPAVAWTERRLTAGDLTLIPFLSTKIYSQVTNADSHKGSHLLLLFTVKDPDISKKCINHINKFTDSEEAEDIIFWSLPWIGPWIDVSHLCGPPPVFNLSLKCLNCQAARCLLEDWLFLQTSTIRHAQINDVWAIQQLDVQGKERF